MLKSYLKQKHQERRWNFSYVNRRMKHVKENCTLFVVMIVCFTFLADMQKFYFWCTFCSTWLWVLSKLRCRQGGFFSSVVDSSGFTLTNFIYLFRKSICEPFLQFVCLFVSNCWICSQTKSPISKIILYLKKIIYTCTCELMHIQIQKNTSLLFRELVLRSVVRSSVTLFAYIGFKANILIYKIGSVFTVW